VFFTILCTLFFLLFAFIMPISLLFRYVKNNKITKLKNWLSEKTAKYFLKLEKHFESEKQKSEQTHLFKSHLALFLLIFTILFTVQFHEGIIGNIWNPKFNKKYEILTNLHYNCQITGSYNTQECNNWKKRYNEYKLNN
jgi:hypothetical protein